MQGHLRAEAVLTLGTAAVVVLAEVVNGVWVSALSPAVIAVSALYLMWKPTEQATRELEADSWAGRRGRGVVSR